VGPYPETVETNGNHRAETASPLEINRVVSGHVDANAFDYFTVPLQAGQRVLIDCHADRLDSRLNAAIVLYAPDGREVARRRNALDGDPFLDLTASSTGDYLLAIHDFLYRGGPEYFYRLRVHQGPHLDFVFPPSGVPGTQTTFAVYGRNLPGGKPAADLSIAGCPLERAECTLALPEDHAAPRGWESAMRVPPHRAMLDAAAIRLGDSDPTPVYFAHDQVIAEVEPNDIADQAQRVVVPCEIVGQLPQRRDIDQFEFQVTQTGAYVCEVYAHRLGNDIDPRLVIEKVMRDENGREDTQPIASVDDPSDRNGRVGSDFDTSTDDPTFPLNVDAEAVYRVQVRNQFGRSQADPRNVYRLSIRSAEPDFRLAAVTKGILSPDNRNVVPQGAVSLRRGGTAPIDVRVERRDGFIGEIHVTAEGLPTGLSTRGAVLGAASSSTTLIIEASQDAEHWAGAIRIVGRADFQGRRYVRHARGGTVVWGTTDRQNLPPHFRATQDIVLAVIDKETVPARVVAGEPMIWETFRGGHLEIPLTVTRHPEFKADLTLVCQGLPNELKTPNVVIKGDAQTGTLPLKVTNANAKPGNYTFYLRADTKFKRERNADAIRIAEEALQTALQKVESLQAELSAARNEASAADAVDNAQQQAAAEAEARLKAAEAEKKQRAQHLANVKKANGPRDFNVAILSTPIQLRIAESPPTAEEGNVDD
jgi:hypothetical protein